MNSLELCRKTRASEVPKFVKVLKAIPSTSHDYRPHPQSRTAIELAWLLAESEAGLRSLMETGKVEWKETKPSGSLETIVAAYEKNATAVNEALARLDEAAWEGKATFLMAGMPPWEDALESFAWGFLHDAIHHRGQLTTYLRPMGGKVPAVYGPSADDTGQ